MKYYEIESIKLFLEYYFVSNIFYDEEIYNKIINLSIKNRTKEKIIINKYLYMIYIISNLHYRNNEFNVYFCDFCIVVGEFKIDFNKNIEKYSSVLENAFQFIKDENLNTNNHNKIVNLLKEKEYLFEASYKKYLKLFNHSIYNNIITPQLKGLHYEILATNELSKIFKLNEQDHISNGPDAICIIKNIKINFEISISLNTKNKYAQFETWKRDNIINQNDLNIYIGSKKCNKYDYSFYLKFDKSFNLIIDKEYNELIKLYNNIKLQSIHGRNKYIK